MKSKRYSKLLTSNNYCCKIKSSKNETALVKYKPYQMDDKNNKKKRNNCDISIPKGIKKSISKNISENIKKKEYPPLLPPPKK